jgi:hypothetical protein
MGTKKVYFEDGKEEEFPQLTMHRNKDGNLFVGISEFETHSTDLCLCLSEEDAITLISELAWQFNLVDDQSMDSGHYFWQGNTNHE